VDPRKPQELVPEQLVRVDGESPRKLAHDFLQAMDIMLLALVLVHHRQDLPSDNLHQVVPVVQYTDQDMAGSRHARREVRS
jgi:hypothetical protein